MENLATLDRTPSPIESLMQRLSLSENGFVFDPVTGNSSTINATGIAIIRQLRLGSNVEQAVLALQKRFNVMSLVVERDVIEFTNLLWKHFK